MPIRTFYITKIKTLNMGYINIWFCSTQLLWWYAVIAISSVVLLVTQDVGHMFHLLPITHFPMLLGLRETVFVPSYYDVHFPVSPVLVSSMVVVLLHWNKCTCVALSYLAHEHVCTWARDPQPFRAEVLHPCLWECSANYKAEVLYCLIIYLRKSFSVVYVEAYSFPPGPV